MQKPTAHPLNIFLLTLLVGMGALFPPAATATLLTVINTNNSGGGSLRQAIADAVSGDTIDFATNVTGTITFSNGPIVIDKSVAILGPGARTLAVRGLSSNIFSVIYPGSAIFPLIANLTLTNGASVNGGGILLEGGDLTISNCIVSGNTASPGQGGVGGGISARGGSLTVIGSTFIGNRAHLGGGIYINGAQVALTNTTLTANEVSAGPDSAGAGIYNYSTLTLQSCTVASNRVTSGSGFGGGIHNLGVALPHLRNTIVAGNSAPTGPDLNGAFISDGYNLLGTGTGSTGFTNGVNNDLVGTNAMLGPLQDNGGPTPTMALLGGSPALDQGISDGLLTDQRGQPRMSDNFVIPNFFGDAADIGAYEYQNTLLVVNTNNSGAGSLRQAIEDNNTFGGGQRIVFSNTVTGVITLASALEITNAVTIIGPGAKVLTVSGNSANRVFDIALAPSAISGLTIANGNSSLGAGIFSHAPTALLTIQNCVFSNNTSTLRGGALWCGNEGAILNSTFRNNKASGEGGGAIYAATGLGITNCTFLGNTATNALGNARGGALYGFSGFTYTYACTIVSNTAGGSGGGVFGGSAVFVRNNIIARNIAPTDPDTTGNISPQGYNFVGNAGSTTGWSSGNGDQVGSSGFPLNPILGTLQDNGGPTPTLSPLPGSPVIDKGKTSPGIPDQRGRARPFDYAVIDNATGGDGSDIGAVEVSPDGPQLNIQLAGTDVVLSWTTNAVDFQLQSVTNLTASNNWIVVGGTPTIAGNQYRLTNSPISGNQFYRLKGN